MRSAEGLNLVAKVTDSDCKIAKSSNSRKNTLLLCVNVKSAAVGVKSMNIIKDLCIAIKETN